ncbi:helix-turn-helix transcriptional regulator [Ekhidna sp.]
MDYGYFTKDFLGNKANQFDFDQFKISTVNYTKKVSEDWHFHEKVHISSIIKGGNLESRQKEEIQVVPGRILVYKAGEIHRNRFTEHPSRNFNIEFDLSFFDEDVALSNLKIDEYEQDSFLKLYFEFLLNDEYSKEAIDYQMKSLFWKDTYDERGTWLDQVKTVLHDRWNDFPTLEELSNEVSVHPVTVCKYFSKRYGLTISEYLRKIKAKRAVNMLLNTNCSFAEVAFTCGFSDQSHMNRVIKQNYGYTPKMIRTAV